MRTNRNPSLIFFLVIPGRCIERAIVDVLSSEDRRRNKEGKEVAGKWKRDGT